MLISSLPICHILRPGLFWCSVLLTVPRFDDGSVLYLLYVEQIRKALYGIFRNIGGNKGFVTVSWMGTFWVGLAGNRHVSAYGTMSDQIREMMHTSRGIKECSSRVRCTLFHSLSIHLVFYPGSNDLIFQIDQQILDLHGSSPRVCLIVIPL